MNIVKVDYEELNYIYFEEVNIKLTKREQDFIKCKLEKLQDMVPLYSTIRLKIEKIEKENYSFLLGNVVINSINGEYYSEQTSFSLSKVWDKLQENLEKQLGEWKVKRFDELIPNVDLKLKLTGGQAV